MPRMTEDLRFPTGKFQFNPAITAQTRAKAIDAIRRTPSALRAAVAGLDDARLDTPYRPGGWTVRQLVHHVPESHMFVGERAATVTGPAQTEFVLL